MKTENFVLYRHTSPSGKIYIGITGGHPKDRWQGGLGYRRNPYFFRAILKYGWENFRHEILAEGLSREAACELEQALIAKHKSNDKNRGYNITNGGEHFTHTPESIEKMRAARRGKGLKTIPEKTREKMSANHAGGADKKPVRCIETGIIYPSVLSASKATGIDKSPISRCCRRAPHYNTAGGLHWEWVEENED